MNIKELHTQEKPVSATSLFKSELGKCNCHTNFGTRRKLKEHITKTPALLICVKGEVILKMKRDKRNTIIG